jgi:hypothetical protein
MQDLPDPLQGGDDLSLGNVLRGRGHGSFLLVKAETDRWTPVIKEAKISLD